MGVGETERIRQSVTLSTTMQSAIDTCEGEMEDDV